MDINVKIRRIIDRENTPVKAICSVTLGDQYVVHGVKVIEVNGTRIMAMPHETRKDAENNVKYRDVFHPVTADARRAMEAAVFAAYDAAKASDEETENDIID
ncbi:MAG: septation protein SpoVG family protein [Clostridia bacterium]|nr:septation protein SpoVG family protein [Clostridia bacterium]